jgi:two-component system OmpR family response regulator
MSGAHILVVDDDPKVRTLLRRCFEGEGFTVSDAKDGSELRACLERNKIALITLDLNLGKENGLDLARDIRKERNIPIIMLTGKGDAIDRVVGLELGADDYVAKPCELRELVARIRSVLRRAGPAAPALAPAPAAPAAVGEAKRVRFGTKWLDHDAQALRDEEGNEHPLTSSEYGLLKAFAANPKRVLSRERLLELANARNAEAFDRAIDIRIMRLRRKIEPDPAHPTVIRTIRGGGYLFTPTGEAT